MTSADAYKQIHDAGGHFVLLRGGNPTRKGSKAKHPLNNAWQRNKPTWDQIEKHISGSGQGKPFSTNGAAPLGLIPGSVGLVVIDIDKLDKGVSYNQAQEAICSVLGQEALEVCRTHGGNNGRHMLFPSPEKKIGNGKFKIKYMAAGDLRGTKGYIIVWDPVKIAKAISVVEDHQPINISLLPGTSASAAVVPTSVGHIESSVESPWHQEALQIVKSAEKNDRNTTLARMIFMLACCNEPIDVDAFLQIVETWGPGEREKAEGPKGTIQRQIDEGLKRFESGIFVANSARNFIGAMRRCGIELRHNTRRERDEWSRERGKEGWEKQSGVWKKIRSAEQTRDRIITKISHVCRKYDEDNNHEKPLLYPTGIARRFFNNAIMIREEDPVKEFLKWRWNIVKNNPNFSVPDDAECYNWFFDSFEWEDPIAHRELINWGGHHPFLSIIHRAYEPGCAINELGVLFGQQGTGKSELYAYILPPNLGWFAEANSIDEEAKEIAASALGKALLEMSELQGITSNKFGKIRNYLTAKFDNSRLAYDRPGANRPRMYSLVGTANLNSGRLPNDPDGLRRFVPLVMKRGAHKDDKTGRGRFAPPYLDKNRILLFDQYLYLYHVKGMRPDLPSHLYPLQTELNERFRDTDYEPEELVCGLDEGDILGYTLMEIVAKIKTSPMGLRRQGKPISPQRFGTALKSEGYYPHPIRRKDPKTGKWKQYRAWTRYGIDVKTLRLKEPDMGSTEEAM